MTDDSPTVEALWTAEAGSEPMQERSEVEAVPGGLAGTSAGRGTTRRTTSVQ